MPNPGRYSTTIYLHLDRVSHIQIVLTNLLGLDLFSIYDGIADEGLLTKEVPLSDLSKGIYFIRVRTDNGIIVEQLIVE